MRPRDKIRDVNRARCSKCGRLVDVGPRRNEAMRSFGFGPVDMPPHSSGGAPCVGGVAVRP